jgi:putative redox protein
MPTMLTSTATLTNSRMQFRGEAKENPSVAIDYIPPLGDDEGYMPLELFLMSLAACAGGSVAALLRRSGKSVDGLHVRADGLRRDEHPTTFEHITLEFMLTSGNASEADLRQVVEFFEATLCPVWAMLKGNVQVETKCVVKN